MVDSRLLLRSALGRLTAKQRAVVVLRDVGWLDAETVIFHSGGDGTSRLLAWNVNSGSITRLTDLNGAVTLSLAQL